MFHHLRSVFVLGILIVAGFHVDSRATAKPNIVLITFDSVRADHMGFLGAHDGLTPSLDRIATQSIVFAQAYAQVPLTVESNVTILTGVYPRTHGVGEFGGSLPPALPYLPDLLHAAGYRTAAFVGSILLDPRSGPFQRYDRGFDVYDAAFEHPQRGKDRYQSVARHGDEVVARATKWLSTTKQRPFFLWVDLHDPEASDTASYDRAVAAADAAAGKLVAFLRAQALHDDSLIVVASSHGESLGAHGEDTHGIFLYDETIHVPLLLKLPQNQMAGKLVKSRARLLDIAPTVLERAGLPVSAQMQGQSLIRIAQSNPQNEQPAYARSGLPQQGFGCAALESWRAGKYLYIRAPQPEIYDETADPKAARNLAASARATLDTLASQMQSLDNRLANDSSKAAGSGLTTSEMQKLASLGYVGVQKAGTSVNTASSGTDPKTIIAFVNETLAALRDLDDGKPEKAISALLPVFASQQNFFLAEYAMGLALAQQQQDKEAIGYFHKAIELQPDSVWAHYAIGLSLMRNGDLSSAAVHLQIASERLPGFSSLHSTLAEIYERLGQSQEAAREHAAGSRKN
jgi:arylsulfatase A-like enzyme